MGASVEKKFNPDISKQVHEVVFSRKKPQNILYFLNF